MGEQMDEFTAWRVTVLIATAIMVGAVVVDMVRNGIVASGLPWRRTGDRDRRRLTDIAAVSLLVSLAAAHIVAASHYIRNDVRLTRTVETTIVTVLLGVAAVTAAWLWAAARIERSRSDWSDDE